MFQWLVLAVIALGTLLWVWLKWRGCFPMGVVLRGLLPNWRFFESIELVPILSYRLALSEWEWSPWVNALPPPARPIRSIVLNAQGNVHLAYQALVERLVSDLDGTKVEEVAQLVSYQLVCALLEFRIRGQLGQTSGCYQFQLTQLDGNPEPLFRSEVHVY